MTKGKEIERKFLIEKFPIDLLNKVESKRIKQYYINQKPEIRIRQSNDKFYLTIKKGEGLVREEFEIEVGEINCEDLQKLNQFDYIEKTRYPIPHNNYIIELDIYNDIGLMTAEIEFATVEESNQFIPPKWFDKELTGLPEFSNMNLAIANNSK